MRNFGTTWWGRAWVEALEGRARLDPNRLPRGRTYARTGRAGELDLAPGEVRARVRGSRPQPYRVRVRIREFKDPEWEAVYGVLAERAGHAAALLDGELDPGVVGALAGAGVELLPGPGELAPSCSCPDWADPCKHSAAVCYLVAERMDRDPFTIFLLRGRTRETVLAGVRAHRSGEPGTRSGAGPDPDRLLALAKEVLDPLHPLPELPEPLAPPEHPGRPVPLSVPYDQELAEELQELARDAAERAFELSWGLAESGLQLGVEQDLARQAAGRVGRPDFDRFARRVAVPPSLLRRWGRAWQAGRLEALAVLEGAAELPSSEETEEALAAMAQLPGRATTRGGRVTNSQAGLQLRLGADGLWYLLERRGGVWELTVPPQADPRQLISEWGGERPRAQLSGRARGA
jgi:uncharacterized Zn finger protein/transposase-like protein